MRNVFRRRVLGLLLMFAAACLLPFAAAAGPKILGQIVRSRGTSTGEVPVPNEGSIVAGDVIQTTSSGSALLRFTSGAEAVLGAGTQVAFNGDAGKLTASLAAGGLTVEAPAGVPFVTLTANSRIEPSGQTAVTYFVSFSPQRGTSVESRRGVARITRLPSGASRLVAAGEEALIAANTAGGPPDTAQQEAGKPSPSVPASAAQPASAGTQQESSKPAPSQPAGPSAPAKVPHHSSTGIIVVAAAIAGGVGAALAASGGGHGPASPSGP